MRIPDFTLERYFAKYEFAVRYMLGASDVEAVPMAELLGLADAECRALWDGLTLGYTEAGGLPRLRAEIATMYAGLTADDIRIFSGAQEGIFIAMQVLLEPGDHAVVVTPTYQSLHEIPRAIGADVTCVALDERDWSLDIDAIEAALEPNTRVLVINFPHSPTGALISCADLERIVGLCDSRGIHLFSDEVYRLLELNVANRLPPAATLGPRVISLGVMSKAFGLAGIRIGWVATHDQEFLARVDAFKDYTTICAAAPSEVLALIGLRAREQLIDRSRAIVNANVALLDAFFARHADRFDWVRPRAGSVCFPRLREGTAESFAEALVREKETLIVPGVHFGAEYPEHFRLGLGRRNMPEALARLEAFLAT
jgi:aspartate/methionine/tyrosine aminotransferase